MNVASGAAGTGVGRRLRVSLERPRENGTMNPRSMPYRISPEVCHDIDSTNDD
jgi:hypothetical protein